MTVVADGGKAPGLAALQVRYPAWIKRPLFAEPHFRCGSAPADVYAARLLISTSADSHHPNVAFGPTISPSPLRYSSAAPRPKDTVSEDGKSALANGRLLIPRLPTPGQERKFEIEV
jgi:hypothetical protein